MVFKVGDRVRPNERGATAYRLSRKNEPGWFDVPWVISSLGDMSGIYMVGPEGHDPELLHRIDGGSLSFLEEELELVTDADSE